MPLLSHGNVVDGNLLEMEVLPVHAPQLSLLTYEEGQRTTPRHQAYGRAADASAWSSNWSSNRSSDAWLRRCGSAACNTLWTPPWKSRRRPIFEGRWACSNRCARQMAGAAIAREIGDGRRDLTASQHRHRVPLGLVMLEQGLITHTQLQKALESQRLRGTGRIGDWLVSECGLESDCVTRGLSAQWSCPVLTTEGFTPEAMALALPRLFIEEYGIMPLRIAASKILYVGFADRLDASSAFAVERMSGLRTESGLIGETSFQRARDLLLDCSFAECAQSVVPDRDILARSIAAVIERRKPEASRLVRLHGRYWLRLWAEATPKSRLQQGTANVSDFLFTIGDED